MHWNIYIWLIQQQAARLKDIEINQVPQSSLLALDVPDNGDLFGLKEAVLI